MLNQYKCGVGIRQWVETGRILRNVIEMCYISLNSLSRNINIRDCAELLNSLLSLELVFSLL